MPRSLDAYMRTQKETTSDAAAIATLFQKLFEAVERTRPFIGEGRRSEVHDRLVRCQKVVVGLRAGLDPSAAPIADNLEKLYSYIEWKLGEANVHLDLQALDDALSVIKDLRDGYQGIAFPD